LALAALSSWFATALARLLGMKNHEHWQATGRVSKDGPQTRMPAQFRIPATRSVRVLHDHNPPLEWEGAGKTGVAAAPGALAQKNNCASAKTMGTGGDHTGLPCAMVYGLYGLSSVNHSVCHRRQRDV
jgi:hypothetical protein